jgi:hypothetical protein
MHKDEINLSVASFGKTTTITQPDDIDIHQFLDTCRSLAIASGYHEDSWKDAVIEMANELLKEEESEAIKQLDEVLAQHKKPAKEFTSWGPLYDSNC